MVWWIWVCLWTGLVLCAGAVLLVFGWRTAAKFYGALHAVSRFGEQAASRGEGAVVAQPLRGTPEPGVLVPVHEARNRYLRHRRRQRAASTLRRTARRDRLGENLSSADPRSGAQKGMNHGKTL